MRKYLNRLTVAVLAAAVLSGGCQPEIDAPEISRGEADFSRYVALGNSLTAGFADGALYLEGQLHSYPNILAQQFRLAGGGSFTQPLLEQGLDVSAPSLVSQTEVALAGRYRLQLTTDCRGSSLAPVATSDTLNIFTLLGQLQPTEPGPYNNLGVPGASVADLLKPGYGNLQNLIFGTGSANPFFVRFASSPNTSIIRDAMLQRPTFFTLWIGNNDVLGYALNGGFGSITPVAGPVGVGFEATLKTLADSLTSAGARGALANIPDVTKIPFFTTVPYDALVLDRQEQADSLTAAYNNLFRFSTGANPLVVRENGVLRQLAPGELVLLTALPKINCEHYGGRTPLPDNLVLSLTEIDSLQQAVRSYNAVIRNLAEAKGLALADANAYLAQLEKGQNIDQVNYSSAFVTGNVFSLDGIHFGPRGAALTANLFIRAINQKYKASIPTVDVNAYKSVAFP